MEDRRPFDVMVAFTGRHVEDGSTHQHPLVWAYDKEHPAAVELVFLDAMTSWIFSRDLLHTAAISGEQAGSEVSDVRIHPSFYAGQEQGHFLTLTMIGADSRYGPALPPETFILDRRVAQEFLYQTYDLVALGEEDYSVQLDAFLHVMQLGGGK